MVAQGHSNTTLRLSERTVETHMRSIFSKAGLLDDGGTDRRVRAVVTFLESGSGGPGRRRKDAVRICVESRGVLPEDSSPVLQGEAAGAVGS
jgi:hypothetical protein